MNRLERKILSQVDRLLPLLVMIAVSLAGIFVRLPLRDFVSGDSQFFLLPWYEEISEHGLREQVGNYNFLYQMLIYLMTRLPINPLYGYKLLSSLFDYGLAVAVGLLALQISENRWKAILAYSVTLLSPLVILNSSAWAQCDSIFCCFAMFALLALERGKIPQAMILLGVAFAFKLQTVFFLPIFLFVYYRRRRFSILQFLWIPAVMCLTALPMLLLGRSFSQMFSVYGGQVGEYPYMALNYPSAWLLLAQEDMPEQYALLSIPAMVLTVGILGGLMICWLQTKAAPRGESLISMAFLLCYTCVLLLPAMHERYGYPYEIMAILLAVLVPKTIPLCVALMGISLCTYGSYLFQSNPVSLQVLAVVNLLIYGTYLWYLQRRLPPRVK